MTSLPSSGDAADAPGIVAAQSSRKIAVSFFIACPLRQFEVVWQYNIHNGDRFAAGGGILRGTLGLVARGFQEVHTQTVIDLA